MSPNEIVVKLENASLGRVRRLCDRYGYSAKVLCAVCIQVIFLVSISHAQNAESTARTEQVPITYFGLHIHDPLKTSWPDVQFGTLRLWDTNTRWRELEPSPGHFDFSRLDALVDVAQRHGVQPILGLGLPPTWASQRPGEAPKWRPGSAAPPSDMQQWREYVRAVV